MVGSSDAAILRISDKRGARLKPNEYTNLAAQLISLQVFDRNPQLAFIGFRSPLIIGTPINNR
jgi:hypothetical protein